MEKKLLYRKVNTRTRGVHHNSGGDFRHERNTKAEANSDANRSSMHGQKHRGLDYTPLFKFLLSKIGSDWNTTFSAALARLDRQDPIFWMVARNVNEMKDVIRIDESTYFSGLYVDSNGLLQMVNAELSAETMKPSCACCTHTFNGIRFTQKFEL